MNRQELIDTYRSFSDEQLLEAYHNPGDYTNEAKEALALTIENRGGLEDLVNKTISNSGFRQKKCRLIGIVFDLFSKLRYKYS
jgi:hypothetical protein